MSVTDGGQDRDVFFLDVSHWARRQINAFRIAFGVIGAAALVVGVLLLVWPAKSIPVLAVLMGIYLIVAGAIRIALGVFSRGIGAGHRVLDLLLGVILFIGGIIALRDLAAASAVLLLVIAIVVGVNWIVEGIMVVSESGLARSHGWAIAYGVVSIVGGVLILAVPVWSGLWLLMVAAIILVVLGVLGIVREFTFGRDALKRMPS